MVDFDFKLPGLQARLLLEIVRRRKWLIFPLGIIGLMVGVLVSFLIPRYYRAETSVVLKNVTLEGKVVAKPGEDPMESEVENARYTIASFRMVLEAGRKLGWKEFFSPRSDDPNLWATVQKTIKRVSVYLIRSGKGGASGILGISYSDKDPQRAADMANMLRDLWIEEKFKAIRDDLQKIIKELRDQEVKAKERWEKALRELKDYERTHRLNPLAGSHET